MRIAFLTTDSREHYKEYSNPIPYFGAAPEALLQGFSRLQGTEVHVLSCVRRKMKSPEKIAANIFYHDLVVPKLGWMSTLYQGCIRAARRRLKAIQPDIVHGQGTERDCAMDAVLSGFPNVVTIHGNMAELARLFRAQFGTFGRLAAVLEGFALKRTAGVFCNSAYTEDLVKPRARRTWRVPNAIRDPFFAPFPPSPKARSNTLVNIGFICPRKRQLELLDVAKELRERGLNFELQFVGDLANGDPYAAAFLEKIKPMEKEGYARYLGTKSVDALIDLLDGAGALVHFPSEEAFGLVVAEGLARDLKFFGARLGGIRDIADDVPGAELFAADDWRGLSAAIGRWIAAGFPRPEGAAALMRARYHPDVIARQHIAIYRDVLGRGAGA
jgi:glycosyltransferase involved in cell wall biosynthesis